MGTLIGKKQSEVHEKAVLLKANPSEHLAQERNVMAGKESGRRLPSSPLISGNEALGTPFPDLDPDDAVFLKGITNEKSNTRVNGVSNSEFTCEKRQVNLVKILNTKRMSRKSKAFFISLLTFSQSFSGC